MGDEASVSVTSSRMRPMSLPAASPTDHHDAIRRLRRALDDR